MAVSSRSHRCFALLLFRNPKSEIRNGLRPREPVCLSRRRRPRQPRPAHAPRGRSARPRRPRAVRPTRPAIACSTSLPAHAERVCVRDLPGNHPDKYPHIHQKLIEDATAGKTVVRLKGGDPLIFGRGGEEAEALRAAGVAYEIVPGVTAALAAGAYLELPLTHRSTRSAIAFVTGHELPNKPGNRLDWKALAAFPGTLAIYMGIARLPVIVGELLKYGKDPDTPAGIVERVSVGEQRSCSPRSATLEEARRHAGLEAPGLILIGDAVAQRPAHPWFESRPLFGQRVLVTRPAHQAGGMVRKLEHLGAVVSRMPVGRDSRRRPTSHRSIARWTTPNAANGTGSCSPARTASTPCSAGSTRSAATCATSAA